MNMSLYCSRKSANIGCSLGAWCGYGSSER
uniref:Uncharacterized protein n=1 Tax=Ascaris lumbricoides TaxID=6252 RepID=A0A0M3IU13_ASCLU